VSSAPLRQKFILVGAHQGVGLCEFIRVNS
jgi:hypothetical protein